MTIYDVIDSMPIKIKEDDMFKGIRYWAMYIEYDKREVHGDTIFQLYKVRSESKFNSNYSVNVGVKNVKVISGTCNCLRY